jgi:CII-binding regulator of phage lambda lysogenization HflD
MAMTETLDLFIDLHPAGLDLDPEELEAYSQNLVADLKDGLAEDAQLARVQDIPEGSKAGQTGFDLGILKAEVNLENTVALLKWLRNRIAGAELELEYGDVKLKYRTDEQLTQQLAALEKISHLTVRVVKNETKDG